MNQRQSDESAARSVISGYFKALNAGDPYAMINLYADNAVLMPQNMPSAAGKQMIQGMYQNAFGKISFRFTFSEDEVVVSDYWAFVRTTSTGTLTPKTGGETRQENNRELFILQKQGDGSWKIARYIFNNIAVK